jgi:hypothetical protein
MSMRIQEAFSNCCEGIKDLASATACWIGKTVTATGAFIAEVAHKVAEFVKPHFENIKTFAQENKQSIIIAAVAFTFGAIATAIITNVFCRGTNATSSGASSSSTNP